MNLKTIKSFVVKYANYLLLAALMYTPIFGSLDALPIRVWDESRITVNACEMYFNKNYVVTTFNDSPDMWNTKPPMLVWMQVFWMKLIGINELAIRLPCAFAAFFTCLAFLFLCLRYFQSFWLGFITIIVLITSPGYVQNHVTRTGDYDALLTLFTTASCLFFFVYTESKKNKHLYLFFLTLTCAVLTKGIAGLLFCPALFIYVLIRKQLMMFVKNKHFYLGVLGFVLFGVGFYFLREHYNPGYIAYIRENELGGRYLVSQGDQPYDEWFYFDKLTQSMMADRYLLIPCGAVLGMLSLHQKLRRFSLFMTIAMVTFFFIVSFGKTRMEQYVVPDLPFFAFSIALILHYLFEVLSNLKPAVGAESPKALPFAFLILILIFPYQKIFAKTYSPKEEYTTDYAHYAIDYFFRDALNGKHDLQNSSLIYSGYDAQNMFYMYALKSKGVKIWKKTFEEVVPGEKLIISQEDLKVVARERFVHTEVKYKDDISVFTIAGVK